MSNKPTPRPRTIRCAIYTRKSTEEGLDQQYNSLDSQRDAGEAYIRSQANEGWELVPDRYDDGGFSGGNIERPALKRLMEDIQAGKIDCVVVYKVDRLSRSLLDFARVMETFDKFSVSFVSVTQHFNTTHSMGRLTLNILLSFAQFEREIIGERIRDKLAAQCRRGQWTGGYRQLGLHSILKGFQFQSGYEKADISKAPRAFEAAAREWMPIGKRQSWDTGKRLVGAANHPVTFVRSVFPEVDENPESISELLTVFESLQTLEREFENRNLGKNMDCLDNWGWINWADRLVAADAIRRWWPFVSPLFNVRFRNELMDTALGLDPVQAYYADVEKHHCIHDLSNGSLQEMDGPAVQRWRTTCGHNWVDRRGEHFMITFSLPCPLKQRDAKVQLGSLFFSLVPHSIADTTGASGTSIVFYDGDIQVSPGHWSVGIQAKLLDALMMHIKEGNLRGQEINSIQVIPNNQLDGRKEPSGEVKRPSLLHFYLKRGFIRRFDGVLEKPLSSTVHSSSERLANNSEAL